MGHRRRAREVALQIVYQLDVQPELSADAALHFFYGSFLLPGLPPGSEAPADEPSDAEGPAGLGVETREFADRLVRGVSADLASVDARIARASKNWRVERMGRVDRCLLRIAVHELVSCPDVPAKVAINEAIEIGKRFGTAETPAFINGILDRVLEDLPAR